MTMTKEKSIPVVDVSHNGRRPVRSHRMEAAVDKIKFQICSPQLINSVLYGWMIPRELSTGVR